jgi:hypothetical protein
MIATRVPLIAGFLGSPMLEAGTRGETQRVLEAVFAGSEADFLKCI